MDNAIGAENLKVTQVAAYPEHDVLSINPSLVTKVVDGGVVGISETADNPGEKPTNPKDVIGGDKLPFHLWPDTATAVGCLGLLDGGMKYGRTNYRALGVRASIYVDACKRHMNAWFEGEDVAEDSGVPHLGHALACLAILVDSQAAGQMVDDRQYPGGYHKLVEELTPLVREIKKRHADKDPHHYTIADH